MKALWKLTTRYFISHKAQTAVSVAVLFFFSTVMMVTLSLSRSFLNTSEIRSQEYYGISQGVSLFVEEAELEPVWETLSADGAGLITVQGQIITPDDTNDVWLGYLDQNAQSLQRLRLAQGVMPQRADEIAMDQMAYFRLGLSQPVGSTVVLTVLENGVATEKEFLLTGLLEDYCDQWSYHAERFLDRTGYASPMLPAVLTGEESFAPIASHLLFSNQALQTADGLIESGVYVPNNLYISGTAATYEAELYQQSASLIQSLTLLFFLLSLIGLWTVSKATLQNRYQFTGLLKMVGMTRCQVYGMFAMQLTIEAVLAWIISLPASLGLSWAAVTISSAVEQNQIYWSFSWGSTVFVGLLLLLAFLTSCFLQLLIKAQRETHSANVSKKRRPSHTSESFAEVWSKLYRKSQFGRNLSAMALTGSCIFVLTAGLFSAELMPMSHYYLNMQSQGSVDYSVYVGFGSGSLENLYCPFQRDSGMTRSSLNSLKSNPDLQVHTAWVAPEMMPVYLLPGDTPCAYLEELVASGQTLEANVQEPAQDELSTAKARFGYRTNDKLITQRVYAVDQETAQYLFELSNSESPVDWEAFATGKTVLAVNNGFSQGDSFLLTIPILSETSQPTRADFQVSVAAALTVPQQEDSFLELAAQQPLLLLSADAVMDQDPQLRFSNISASNANPSDENSCLRASETMHRAQACGKSLEISDQQENQKKWEKTEFEQKVPVYVLIVTFLILSMVSICLLNSMKLKANLHSYALLRAVGLEADQLKRHLMQDCLRSCLMGIGIGAGCALLFCSMLILRFHYLPTLPILLTVSLPAAIIGSGLLLFFIRMASSASLKAVTQQSITEQLEMILW